MRKRFKRKVKSYHHQEGPKKSLNWKKILLISIASLLALGLLVAIAGYSYYKYNLSPVNPDSEDVKRVVIESGTSYVQIADLLEENDLIKSSTVFRWYLVREGISAELKAGVYDISKSASAQEIAQKLIDGDVVVLQFQVSPGVRLDSIRQKMIEFGFEESQVDEALSKTYDLPVLADKPQLASLEGYLFPDTYNLSTNSSAQDLVLQILSNFDAKVTDEMKQSFKKKGLSLHEAFALASMVQKEVSGQDDQRKVASVFFNRLEIGQKLESDPTFKYAAHIDGVKEYYLYDSPYNTYVYPGIPPGPISNFNLSALEAVASPADTDFFYFIADREGVNRFAKTFAEHQANINQYGLVDEQD